MDIYEFIDKLEQIFDMEIYVSMDDPFVWVTPEYSVTVEHLPHDGSLSVKLEYQGVMYYYNFNDNLEDTIVDSSKFKNIKIEIPEDILEKIDAVVNDKKFDSRITIPLDLTKDEIYKLMALAHEKDMTLNKYVEFILQKVIDSQGIPENIMGV